MASIKTVPGTAIPYGGAPEDPFGAFRPLLDMTDGLSLGQICSITGLESATVQNWVRRGFVPHPERKKYRERHLARILLISSLRDCMQIDQIGQLLILVNGDTDREDDDIVSETRLYTYFCLVVRRLEERTFFPEEILRLIRQVTVDYRAPDDTARQRLTLALQIMVNAYLAGWYKQSASRLFARLEQATDSAGRH